MEYVPHDGYRHTVEGTPVLAQGVGVEQGLGGVFVAAVAGVYHRSIGPLGYPVGGAGHAVPDDQDVGPVRADDLHRVAEALPLAQRGRAGGEGEGVGREPPGGRFER